eukprot:12417363-Karenia_brevis.AAC.1
MNWLPPDADSQRLPGARKLPIVDIYEDPGIWVCLDEGCTSNCHVKEWAKNAAEKLKKFTIRKPESAGGGTHEFDWIHRQEREFTGI